MALKKSFSFIDSAVSDFKVPRPLRSPLGYLLRRSRDESNPAFYLTPMQLLQYLQTIF